MQSLIFYKKLIFSAILAVFIVPVGIFAVEEFDIEPKETVKETDDEFLEKFLRVVKPGQ